MKRGGRTVVREQSRRYAEITKRNSRSKAQQPSCDAAYAELCHWKYNMVYYICNDD